MRQINDQPFAIALDHLATGDLTEEDIHLFRSRQVKSIAEVPDNAIHLFRSNLEVNAFNVAKLQRIQGELVIATAIDKLRGDISSSIEKKTS